MNQNKLDKIIGMDTIKRWQNQVKDSDGDKLMDIIDCKPHDKHKQGVIHDIAARFGKGRVQTWGQEGQADSENKRQTKSEVRQIRRDIYMENEKRFAKEKAKIDMDRRVSRYKSGSEGFFSSLSKQVMSATASPKAKVKHKVKGKKGKARVVYVQQRQQAAQQPRQPRSMDFTTGHIFIK